MKKVKAIYNYSTWKQLQDIIIKQKNMYIAVDDIRYLWYKYSSDMACSMIVMNNETIKQFLEYYLDSEYIYDED